MGHVVLHLQIGVGLRHYDGSIDLLHGHIGEGLSILVGVAQNALISGLVTSLLSVLG